MPPSDLKFSAMVNAFFKGHTDFEGLYLVKELSYTVYYSSTPIGPALLISLHQYCGFSAKCYSNVVQNKQVCKKVIRQLQWGCVVPILFQTVVPLWDCY